MFHWESQSRTFTLMSITLIVSTISLRRRGAHRETAGIWEGWGLARRDKAKGECLPGARPAHARRATFVLSVLSLAPS